MSSNKRKQPPYKVCGAFDSFLIEKVLSSRGGVGVGCETLVQTTVYYDFSNLTANPAPKIWLFSQTNKENFSLFETNRWRGHGGRRLGEKGSGGVREVGEEGWEAGFPRWQEAGEKGEKIMPDCTIFGNQNNAKRQELGLKRLKPPVPPPQIGKKTQKP